MNRPLATLLRRHQRTALPPASPPPRSIWDGGDQPWPIEPDVRVRILDRDGRPTECSPVRLVKAGERVEADIAGNTIRGVLI
jgi:hypothetical protein